MEGITVKEAVKVTGVTHKAIYKAIDRGDLIKVSDKPIRLDIESVYNYRANKKKVR